MIKKILLSLLLVLCIFSFNSINEVSASTSSLNIKDPVENTVLSPSKSSFSTRNKAILISGKAPSGTTITIDVYGTTDLTRKNFNLDKLPTDSDYVLVNSETVKAGNLGFYQRQIDLSNGINKVLVNFQNQESNREFIIYLYDRDITESMINRTRDVKVTEMVPILK